MKLRQWQIEAFNAYREHLTAQQSATQSSFLLEACPGAGKTYFAGHVAARMLQTGRAKRLIVLVPTAHLRQQWAMSAKRWGERGVTLDYTSSRPKQWISRADNQGAVITYAQLAQSPEIWVAPSKGALILPDEVHHAGDGATWGDAMRIAFKRAAHLLLLSGTPFRSDKLRIPFLRYDEHGSSQPDYQYALGDGLRDGVVRPIVFFTFTGEIDDGYDVHQLRPNIGYTRQEAARLNAALDPNNGWLPNILRNAATMLDDLRKTHRDAAGLIVCRDQQHAYAVADMLAELTKVKPTVVVSDDAQASNKIDAFTNSNEKWIVSVRMVSEGIDIPRLRVGVFATNVTTSLFFRQFIGRIMRVTHKPPQTAYCYLPADRRIVELAQKVLNEQRHHAGLTTVVDGALGGADSAEPIRNAPTALDNELFMPDRLPSASAALDQVYINGQLALFPDLAPKNTAAMRTAIDQRVADLRSEPTVTDAPTLQSRSDLRREISRLISLIVRSKGQEHAHLYARLNSMQGVEAQDHCTDAQLAARIETLRRWL